MAGRDENKADAKRAPRRVPPPQVAMVAARVKWQDGVAVCTLVFEGVAYATAMNLEGGLSREGIKRIWSEMIQAQLGVRPEFTDEDVPA